MKQEEYTALGKASTLIDQNCYSSWNIACSVGICACVCKLLIEVQICQKESILILLDD